MLKKLLTVFEEGECIVMLPLLTLSGLILFGISFGGMYIQLANKCLDFMGHGGLVTNIQPSQNEPAAGSTSRRLWEFDRLHCYIK